MKRILVKTMIAGLMMFPLLSQAEDLAKKEKLCREFTVKALPDYAQQGIDGIIKKNKGRVTLHCKPLFPVSAPITDKQFTELRKKIYRSCMEDTKLGEKEIKEILKKVPEDC